jgi:ubiquinone/menaquinone biosynthesis C-methylase UbiE
MITVHPTGEENPLRFRETLAGRMIYSLPGGERILESGSRLLRPYYEIRVKRDRVLQFKQNVREAYVTHGIKYVPRSGFWPPILSLPVDTRFSVSFPDGEKLEIHLTEERGYQDIDGMAHIGFYEKFATEVLPANQQLPERTSDRILDCACGSGYGSNYLSEIMPCSVTGVDIEKSVINYAKKRYGTARSSLNYVNASATDLSFLATGSIHAIISIETIEHISEADKALAEYRRVLQPGGILFVSSPDATDRPDTLISAYHEREYSLQEFESLLKGYFRSVSVESSADGAYLLATCRKE